jgi:hypothetical protein
VIITSADRRSVRFIPVAGILLEQSPSLSAKRLPGSRIGIPNAERRRSRARHDEIGELSFRERCAGRVTIRLPHALWPERRGMTRRSCTKSKNAARDLGGGGTLDQLSSKSVRLVAGALIEDPSVSAGTLRCDCMPGVILKSKVVRRSQLIGKS